VVLRFSLYTRSFLVVFRGGNTLVRHSLIVLLHRSLPPSHPSRSLRVVVCGPAHSEYLHPSIEKRTAFLLLLHHGFRAGYLDSPPASGPRHVPQTVDTASLRSAVDQDDFPAGVRPQDTPLDQPGACWPRARWPRHITAVVELLDRGVVHTPTAAAAGQQCVATAARVVDSCFARIDQPRTRSRQQRQREERLGVDEDGVSTQVRAAPASEG
jgi:hypothetical protein